jgi:hypothetical protein
LNAGIDRRRKPFNCSWTDLAVAARAAFITGPPVETDQATIAADPRQRRIDPDDARRTRKGLGG